MVMMKNKNQRMNKKEQDSMAITCICLPEDFFVQCLWLISIHRSLFRCGKSWYYGDDHSNNTNHRVQLKVCSMRWTFFFFASSRIWKSCDDEPANATTTTTAKIIYTQYRNNHYMKLVINYWMKNLYFLRKIIKPTILLGFMIQ